MKRQISIKDVAARAGVSKSTVSRVVSDRGGSVSPKTLEAVSSAIQELGYTRNTFAAGLRTSRTYLILLLVPDAANPFWSEISRAVQERLEAEGYFLVVGSTDWSESREESYLDVARAGRFDGLIANSLSNDVQGFSRLGLPVVLIGERSEETVVDTVGSATYDEVRTALEYLYGRGHRGIAVAVGLTGSDRFLSRRYRAYQDFLEAKGLPLDPELVFTINLSERGGGDLASRLLALPRMRERVSALLCGNDLLAISAMNALRVGGIEPGRDLSIVGMDDIPAASLSYPALTSIRKPRTAIGRTAAEFLLKRLAEAGRLPEKRLFNGELVERASVADGPMRGGAALRRAGR